MLVRVLMSQFVEQTGRRIPIVVPWMYKSAFQVVKSNWLTTVNAIVIVVLHALIALRQWRIWTVQICGADGITYSNR